MSQRKPSDAGGALKPQNTAAQLLFGARTAHVQSQIHQIPIWRGMEQPGGRVKRGQPVPRAVHELEQLGNGVHEVEHLRPQEQQQRLAEVAQDARHCDGHAGEVCVGVADEDAGGEPVEVQQGQGGGGQRQHQVCREQMAVPHPRLLPRVA
eukprot:CAMPEP_0206142338 /NCGR_PEP_ID=MMETSP1473-20131121/16507_1 /ASSEMBLY_ACC=CAM_ASM_001109 /TAXON_ID=1461547 /ORGANISM="Stichococcus sp, Strain RCC1054" /LENGTH=150 /DNA_ID=CAMNT_0053537295 /DNA_START=235 /DNA_END=687 /DNA_ORIENTATION=-